MKVLVDWPDDLTREQLQILAAKIDIQIDADHYWPGQAAALRRLAAIAPEAPKPVEEVKRWVWTDEHGKPRFSDGLDHPGFAALVPFPRAPAPKLREVTLWEHRSITYRTWTYDNEPVSPEWRKRSTGWVEE